MDKGWVLLYRSIREHWIWEEKPVSRLQAWLDIILSANHKETKILFNGKVITVDRGSFITSIRKLSERWGWGEEKTLNFLRELEKDGMILRDANNRRTLLVVINYDKFQHPPNTDRATHPATGRATHPATHPAQTKNNEATTKQLNEKSPLPPEEKVGLDIPDEEWEEM